MPACFIMVKFEYSTSIPGDSYNSESKAFTYTRKVLYVPVCCQKRQAADPAESINIFHDHLGFFRKFADGLIMLLMDFTNGLFLELFLDHPGIRGKTEIVFHVPFHGKCIIGEYSNIIQNFPEFNRVPPA